MSGRTIWKYELDPGFQILGLGGNPKVVHVGSMFPATGFDDAPVVWIEHTPDGPPTELRLTVYGTGFYIPDGRTHVGSVCLPHSGLVWHVYQDDQ